jgi:pimeloyl-ACP methyl ester carboxylesterase
VGRKRGVRFDDTPASRVAVVVALALTASGCFTRSIAEKMGVSGWFRCDAPAATYGARFSPVDLTDPRAACPAVAAVDRPIIVLVHGVGGDGPEMEQAVQKLAAWHPAGIFMVRWVPYDERDAIVARIAAGVSRLAQCWPQQPIVVVAHSAGGVVTSRAAAQMKAGDVPIDVLTVASPLAGTVRRAGNADGAQEAAMMLDLGSRIASYPVAAPAVHVVHLRTHAPADHVMQAAGDLVPNDPKIGVPGAPQVDLPDTLGHSEALDFVVEALIAGRAQAWLSPGAAATPVR